jgi:hypothetical protein
MPLLFYRRLPAFGKIATSYNTLAYETAQGRQLTVLAIWRRTLKARW